MSLNDKISFPGGKDIRESEHHNHNEEPDHLARSDARPAGMWTVAGQILGSVNILSWRLVIK